MVDLLVVGLGYVGLPVVSRQPGQDCPSPGWTCRRASSRDSTADTRTSTTSATRRSTRSSRSASGRRRTPASPPRPSRSSSACRRRSRSTGVRTSAPCGRGRRHRAAPAVGQPRGPRVDDLPRHHRGGAAADPEQGSGLVAGKDFHLGYSPERIDPGNKKYGLRNTPKVVGGLNDDSRDATAALYGRLVDTSSWPRASARPRPRSCSRTPTATSTSRSSTRWRGSSTSSTSTSGTSSGSPAPSPSASRRSTPARASAATASRSTRTIFPTGSARNSDTGFRFVELAQEINSSMPAYVAQPRRRAAQRPSGMRGATARRSLLLGVTYKPDIADQRESPAVGARPAPAALWAPTVLLPRPARRPAWAAVPGATPGRGRRRDRRPVRRTSTILLQNHSAYDVDAIAKASRVFFDTRGVAEGDGAHKL